MSRSIANLESKHPVAFALGGLLGRVSWSVGHDRWFDFRKLEDGKFGLFAVPATAEASSDGDAELIRFLHSESEIAACRAGSKSGNWRKTALVKRAKNQLADGRKVFARSKQILQVASANAGVGAISKAEKLACVEAVTEARVKIEEAKNLLEFAIGLGDIKRAEYKIERAKADLDRAQFESYAAPGAGLETGAA